MAKEGKRRNRRRRTRPHMQLESRTLSASMQDHWEGPCLALARPLDLILTVRELLGPGTAVQSPELGWTTVGPPL